MGKSFVNPESSILSKAYDEFVDPIDKTDNGFDFHGEQHRDDTNYQRHDTRGTQVYYMQSVPEQLQYARELYERIQYEFPEIAFGRNQQVHTLQPRLKVDTFNPHQTGALFSWLVIHRGPCSVLIHPNTGNDLKDHIELATWMGQPWPLNLEFLKKA
ncbi:hypothetical protein VNI00_000735 [Paramarasmius palmivorus]|uniref:DOPA 4,5-dioxygenase n=1 Tax=Paramarasmius palmivorus TaxID=297713 RepID=A0AAW0E768_9AGAR